MRTRKPLVALGRDVGRDQVVVDSEGNLACDGLQLLGVEHGVVVVAACVRSLGIELVHVQERRKRRNCANDS
mgnify:CR=1 FL=1